MALKIILCVCVLALGVAMIVMQVMKTSRCTEETTATVVGFERKRTGTVKHRRYKKYPVVEFQVEDATIHGTADVSSLRYKEGTELQVNYNREKPEEFVVKGRSFVSNVLGGAFLAVLGLLGLYIYLLA